MRRGNFSVAAAATRSAAIACGGGGRAGSTAAYLASTNIAGGTNFREAVRDLETAVNQGGFELGT